MANHKSAEKRIRQTKRRTETNRARSNRIKAHVKKVETAITKGDKKIAQQALKEAQSEMMRGVKSGIIKLGAASRKMSRLSARIKQLAV